MRIKDLPESERPREKAMRHGLETLSNIEVMAIIIGSGVKDYSALDISTRLITMTNGLRVLENATFNKIQEVAGINQISALRLGAVFELCRRIEKARYEAVSGPLDAKGIYNRYRHDFVGDAQENLILVLLNKQGAILKEKRMYRGTGEYFPISISEIIAELLSNKCFTFFIVHNHPSGQAQPSDDDLIATKVLYDEATRLKITLKDHVIIAREGYYSFMENNLIKMRGKR